MKKALLLFLILFVILAMASCDVIMSVIPGNTPYAPCLDHIYDYDNASVTASNCTEATKLATCKNCESTITYTERIYDGHSFVDEVCIICGVSAPSKGLKFTLNADGVSYSVTGIGTCTDSDILIPSTYNGLSVTSIGYDAFRYCDSLTSITIPDSVTSIGDWAFASCDNLTSVTFGEKSQLTSICIEAFYDCDSLTSITIPASVTSIDYKAFASCYNLTSVAFGENSQLTSIGSYAFEDCSSLTSITIPDSVTSIGDVAFYNCYSLTSVTFGENSQLTSIGIEAFHDCSRLTSITIPASVTSIGNYAFHNCDRLTSITVDENNQYYKSIDGNLYTKNGKTLIQYAIGKKDTGFTIPDSATSIGYGAFAYCDSLTSVTIPASVTSIGNSAFHDCDSLTSITISSGVTSISDRAFYSCDSLTSITIPASVTSIGYEAFRYCSDLKTVYYTGTRSEWNNINIGSENSPLTSATRYYYAENRSYCRR